ncbi:MAG: hypothetical protein JST40_13435 [Armatimonadetes bacterium]|nr:hypothetical protein [Armatimonadota bacterium]
MMTLSVSYELFKDEVLKRLPGERVYISREHGESVLTAGGPSTAMIVRTSVNKLVEEIRKDLQPEIETHLGRWSEGSQTGDEPPLDLFIGGVSYQSNENRPGLWLDAYRTEPSVQEVLKNFHHEFVQSGDAGDLSFEDFLAFAHPNVVVYGPNEIRYHLGQKEPV